MKEKEIQSRHETAVLKKFNKYFRATGKELNIISNPQPPDAIVTIDGNEAWIEITDAFFSPELAESMTSSIATNKLHRPIPRKKQFVTDPDQVFCNELCKVILKKYDKKSIKEVYKLRGKGILLVGVINPFSWAEEVAATEKNTILNAIKSKEQFFSEMYLYDYNANGFYAIL